MKNPCMQDPPCPKRELGCQAKCPEYLAFFAENRKADKEREQQAVIKDYCNYTYYRVQKNLNATKGAVTVHHE